MAIYTGRLPPNKDSPMTTLRLNNIGRPPLNQAALPPKKKINNFVGQQQHTSTLQMMGVSKPSHMSLTNWLLQGGATVKSSNVQKATINLGGQTVNSAKVLKIMKAK